MRYVLPILLILLNGIYSCKPKLKSVSDPHLMVEDKPDSLSAALVVYDDVLEMLKVGRDYRQENGTLQVISEDPDNLHLQVSSQVFSFDSDEFIETENKRDLVYAVYQIFAQTNVDTISISAVPLKMKDLKTQDDYLAEHTLNVKVTRKEAGKILQLFAHTTSFKDLYELHDGPIWLPGKKFDRLKNENVHMVVYQLQSVSLY